MVAPESGGADGNLFTSCTGGGIQAVNGTLVLSCWVPQPPDGTTYLATVSPSQASLPGWSVLGRQFCPPWLACEERAQTVIAVSESAAVVSRGSLRERTAGPGGLGN